METLKETHRRIEKQYKASLLYRMALATSLVLSIIFVADRGDAEPVWLQIIVAAWFGLSVSALVSLAARK